MIRLLFVTVLCLGLACWLAACVLRGLRTGKVNAGGTVISRSDRPAMYWLAVAGQLVFIGLAVFTFYKQVLTP